MLVVVGGVLFGRDLVFLDEMDEVEIYCFLIDYECFFIDLFDVLCDVVVV